MNLKKILNSLIILFFCMINIFPSSKAIEVDEDSPFFTCFNSKARNRKIDELCVLKNMFKDLEFYINEPNNSGYKSRNCILDIGKEIKHKFNNISRFSENFSDEIFIQVHNYIRFLHILCNDIIVPIHTKFDKPAIIHDKTYNIINEILKNTSNLINIIERKYSDSIRYMERIGSFTITGDIHRTYYMYISPIYLQLKNLNKLLKPYKFKTIYIQRSEFA